MPFEQLRETLLKAGFAPRHVRRYLAELRDHLDDLIQTQRDAGYDAEDAAIRAHARLGDDADLAAAMLARPRLRSWPARAPGLVFGLLPLLFLILLVALPVILLAGISEVIRLQAGGPGPTPDWFRDLVLFLCEAGNWSAAPFTAILFTIMAARQRLAPHWPLLAGALLAAIGLHMQASFPGPNHHGGSLGIGLSFPAMRGDMTAALMKILLTLTPALIYFALRLRSDRTSR